MRLVFLLICSLLARAYYAQQFVDVLKLSYRLSPNNEMLEHEGETVDINDYMVNIFLPFEQADKTYIFAGANYFSSSIGDFDVYSLSLYGGFSGHIQRESVGGWQYTTLLIPKISLDGGKIVSKDAQIGAYTLFRKKKSEKFKWKVGAYMNTERFGFLLVPIIGLEWQANESYKVDITAPMSASVRKTLNDKMMLGLQFTGRRYSYNISRSAEYLEVGDNTVNLYTDIYLTGKVVLNLQVGHSILRNYGIYNDGDDVIISFGPVDLQDDRPSPRNELSQGWNFRGGLFYRLAAN
ncbi:MAG: hypothetical protein HKN45_10750 [Flavobacteriales bacterium]|nr:hypothetical protein [Flavobacteriales bacterium]